MPTEFTSVTSGNYKSMAASHRKWGGAVIANGESWPRFLPPTAASSSDVVRLGIMPTFSLAAPTTAASGTSSAATYGIVLVYRAANYKDGLTGDDIQSNASNIQDVPLTSSQAAVVTKVVTTDTKVDKLDVYAAVKVSGVYGTFYRVAKGATNAAGTTTVNINYSNGVLIGSNAAGDASVASDTVGLVLATDNDYPTARPIVKQVNGRLVSLGGIVKRVTATFTNGSGTVTTSETVYDGIEFWFIKRDTDTSGGIDGHGTYICRYATANTVTLVNADGTADTYDGATGSGTTSIWQEPNRGYSKPLNPHSEPSDNVSNEYPGPLLAGEKVPSTSRMVMTGRDFTIAEDYDRLPVESYVTLSEVFGCSSPHGMVATPYKLYWIDFGRRKREILMCDGASVVPIATQKIKSILDRVTLDSNGDVWRVGFIHGAYYQNEDVIRWGLYMDNSTVANYILELDIGTNEVSFYPMRYLDVFTYGQVRGRVFIGQYGWTGGVARLGQDNVTNRFRDWTEGGTLSGSLASSGHSTTTLTIASGTLYTTSNALKGIQLLVWKDSDSNGVTANPTYYHCRVSSNTDTIFTINYVEVMNAVGVVTSVANELPETPSGTGWKWAVGVIQGMVGPKWISAKDTKTRISLESLTAVHKGQAVATNLIRASSFENFDNQPRESQYMSAKAEGAQIADTTMTCSSFNLPKTNPSTAIGFSLTDNNVSTATTSLDIESIVLDIQESAK